MYSRRADTSANSPVCFSSLSGNRMNLSSYQIKQSSLTIHGGSQGLTQHSSGSGSVVHSLIGSKMRAHVCHGSIPSSVSYQAIALIPHLGMLSQSKYSPNPIRELGDGA